MDKASKPFFLLPPVLFPKLFSHYFFKGDSSLYQIFPVIQLLMGVCPCPGSCPQTLTASPLDSRLSCIPVASLLWGFKDVQIFQSEPVWCGQYFIFLSMDLQKQPPKISTLSFYKRKGILALKWWNHHYWPYFSHFTANGRKCCHQQAPNHKLAFENHSYRFPTWHLII